MTLEYLKQNWVSHEDPDLQKTMWDRAAVNYEKKPVPDFETNSFLQFVEKHVPLHEIRSSLDIGCGAGAYSLALASRINHVTGVDISPAMINAANGQAEKMGIDSSQAFRDDEIPFCFDYLWLNGYEPQIFYHQEVWTPVRTLENSLHWCLDRARLHQEITPEQEQIAGKYLESQAVDGMVQEHVDTTIVTMFWEVI